MGIFDMLFAGGGGRAAVAAPRVVPPGPVMPGPVPQPMPMPMDPDLFGVKAGQQVGIPGGIQPQPRPSPVIPGGPFDPNPPRPPDRPMMTAGPMMEPAKQWDFEKFKRGVQQMGRRADQMGQQQAPQPAPARQQGFQGNGKDLLSMLMMMQADPRRQRGGM